MKIFLLCAVLALVAAFCLTACSDARVGASPPRAAVTKVEKASATIVLKTSLRETPVLVSAALHIDAQEVAKEPVALQSIADPLTPAGPASPDAAPVIVRGLNALPPPLEAKLLTRGFTGIDHPRAREKV